MRRILFAFALLTTSAVYAQDVKPPAAASETTPVTQTISLSSLGSNDYSISKISGSKNKAFDDYVKLAEEVAPYRERRLISLADFNTRSNKAKVLILDARSAAAFQAGHIKGAVNLPLPSFNNENLRKIIGRNKNREILIYCNNNFTDNRFPIATKVARTSLNISTFINLYKYGYKNVYELGEAIESSHAELAWVGENPKQFTKIGPRATGLVYN
jgi:phage shock protein E